MGAGGDLREVDGVGDLREVDGVGDLREVDGVGEFRTVEGTDKLRDGVGVLLRLRLLYCPIKSIMVVS